MTRSDTEPAGHPADQTVMELIPYVAGFTDADYALIQRGFVPKEMEDKWAIRVVDGSIFFHRSWTGRLIYCVDLLLADTGGARVACARCAADVLASSNPAYQAALLAFLIDNLLLGQSTPFPRPAGVEDPVPGLLQHAIAGTRYAEIVVDTANSAAHRPLTIMRIGRAAWRAIRRAAGALRGISRS